VSTNFTTTPRQRGQWRAIWPERQLPGNYEGRNPGTDDALEEPARHRPVQIAGFQHSAH
jgi:hypothetical protein